MSLDTDKIRQDFPILKRKIGDNRLVYLDNAASSQKPKMVIDAIKSFYENNYANVHRAPHTLACEATDMYENARIKVAKFINSPTSKSVVWTSGTTDGINMVADFYKQILEKGDKVVVSALEHHSNLVPWQKLCELSGASLQIIDKNDDGTLDMSQANRLVDRSTKVVAAPHISNALGTVVDAKKLGEIAHRNGAVFVLDAAQSVPHMPIDVQDLGCDFMAFSAHKMLGPTGVGVLYAKLEAVQDFMPTKFGGEMVDEVTYSHATFAEIPHRFEAGTPNIVGSYATGVALDYLSALGMQNVFEHTKDLTSYALDRLSNLGDYIVVPPKGSKQRSGAVSFIHPKIHPHDLGTTLDNMGVAVRAGTHCAMPLLKSFGYNSTVRASFYIYNTHAEVDILCDSLKQIEGFFVK